MTWRAAFTAIRSKIVTDLSDLDPVWAYAPPEGYSRYERDIAVEYLIVGGSVESVGVGSYADLENAKDRTNGIVQFDIYHLAKVGRGTAEAAADAVREAMRGVRLSLGGDAYIQMGTPSFFDLGNEGGSFRIQVSVPFRADGV